MATKRREASTGVTRFVERKEGRGLGKLQKLPENAVGRGKWWLDFAPKATFINI
jgi:hypothetical protein